MNPAFRYLSARDINPDGPDEPEQRTTCKECGAKLPTEPNQFDEIPVGKEVTEWIEGRDGQVYDHTTWVQEGTDKEPLWVCTECGEEHEARDMW